MLVNFVVFTSVFPFTIFSRYEEDYSLRNPYQGSFMDPFGWTTIGTALISSEKIILTSDTKSQAGSIWLVKPIRFQNWRVTMDFRIHGDSKHLFGDGIAFWYVKTHSVSGPVYGVNGRFSGLGLIFDTYPNHRHDEEFPRVSAQINDGTRVYDTEHDGLNTEFTGCSFDFRNNPSSAVITYFGLNSTLIVEFKESMTNVIHKCFVADFVDLPIGYYIGVSAATGDLSGINIH